MAKLKKDLAKQATEEADNWVGRGILPAGHYLCRLRGVDTTKSGPAGAYWVWEYETIEVADQPAGRRFWDNTSLSAKAIGRLGKTFEAFGVPTTTDTDDLIGELVNLEIKIGTIQKGDKTGEQRNEVVAILPADSHPNFDEIEEAKADAKGGGSSADDFV